MLDAGLNETARVRHLQGADAARATLGLCVEAYTITDAPLDIRLAVAGSDHASWGTVSRPDSLLRAAKHLVDEAHVDAVAVVGKFPDDEDEEMLAAYRGGSGVDAIAGAEAVISHLVTRELHVPCAHAPSLPPLDADPAVSPKSSAEELGYTFLSCVLVGLSRAPRLIDLSETKASSLASVSESMRRYPAYSPSIITADDVNALVLPKDTFEGACALSLAARPGILIISVDDSRTVLNVSPSSLGISEDRVVRASSYAEAAGFIAAHRAGIDLRALVPSVAHVPRI